MEMLTETEHAPEQSYRMNLIVVLYVQLEHTQFQTICSSMRSQVASIN